MGKGTDHMVDILMTAYDEHPLFALAINSITTLVILGTLCFVISITIPIALVAIIAIAKVLMPISTAIFDTLVQLVE